MSDDDLMEKIGEMLATLDEHGFYGMKNMIKMIILSGIRGVRKDLRLGVISEEEAKDRIVEILSLVTGNICRSKDGNKVVLDLLSELFLKL